MSLIAGVVKDLKAAVRVLSTGAPKVSGTIYVAVRLELDGDADDGKYWDTTSPSWVAAASVAAWPTATYGAAGDWVYQLPAAATTGKVSTTKPARIGWRMTDNVTTPASETASSGEFEDVVYGPTTPEADVDTGYWNGTAVATPATAGVPDINVKSISNDSTAADNLEAAADGTGYNLGGGAVVAASVTGAVGSVTGAVGSVTGAVGSVTGNVGGNVTGSVGSLAAQAKADVNAEVDSALDTAVPGTPTAGSVNERLKTMDDADIPARLPAALVSGRMDSAVGAMPLTIDTGKTGEAVLKDILGMVSGNISKSGDAYTFYARDGVTALFTLTIAASSRTRS